MRVKNFITRHLNHTLESYYRNKALSNTHGWGVRGQFVINDWRIGFNKLNFVKYFCSSDMKLFKLLSIKLSGIEFQILIEEWKIPFKLCLSLFLGYVRSPLSSALVLFLLSWLRYKLLKFSVEFPNRALLTGKVVSHHEPLKSFSKMQTFSSRLMLRVLMKLIFSKTGNLSVSFKML